MGECALTRASFKDPPGGPRGSWGLWFTGGGGGVHRRGMWTRVGGGKVCPAVVTAPCPADRGPCGAGAGVPLGCGAHLWHFSASGVLSWASLGVPAGRPAGRGLARDGPQSGEAPTRGVSEPRSPGAAGTCDSGPVRPLPGLRRGCGVPLCPSCVLGPKGTGQMRGRVDFSLFHP